MCCKSDFEYKRRGETGRYQVERHQLPKEQQGLLHLLIVGKQSASKQETMKAFFSILAAFLALASLSEAEPDFKHGGPHKGAPHHGGGYGHGGYHDHPAYYQVRTHFNFPYNKVDLIFFFLPIEFSSTATRCTTSTTRPTSATTRSVTGSTPQVREIPHKLKNKILLKSKYRLLLRAPPRRPHPNRALQG